MQYKILLVLLLIMEINASDEDVLVCTQLGKIKGSIMETRLGKTIFAFRGIPFAEPPVGELRFKNAVPVKPWKDVLDASKECPACIQSLGINLSENCLTLNVYTKNTKPYKKLPVIVFIHPGGFSEESSQSILFGPRYLLDHDVVLVTINYRLSSLGFLNIGDYRASGNYGFKDQVVALRFIRDNIASFGGDPYCVTLTGQSAGSRSIILHMVSPMSRGLFHRAIGMSGSMITPIPAQREQIDLATKQARLLNCSTENMDVMMKCLKERPAEAFGETVSTFKEFYGCPIVTWYPSIEPEIDSVERFLPDDPVDLINRGKLYQVPFIYGVTKDEFSFVVSSGIEEALEGNDKMFRELNERWDELAPICFGYERGTDNSKFISCELYKFYFGHEKLSLRNSDCLRRLFANAIVHFPAYKAAMLISRNSRSPLYFYKFTYKGRYSTRVWRDTKKPSSGVAHNDDLQYLFNVENDIYHPLAKQPLFADSDPEIVTVKRLTELWVHFAKTGEPLPRMPELYGNVTWERFTPETKNYLNMGEEFVMENDFLGKEMRLWEKLFP